MPPTSIHSGEIVDRLRVLWSANKLSAREIGLELGLNKNQVLGLVHRLKLETKDKTKSHRKPKPSPIAAGRIVWPPRGHCDWPVGHPGEPGFRFCGAPTPAGQHYCQVHHRAAYSRPEPVAMVRPKITAGQLRAGLSRSEIAS